MFNSLVKGVQMMVDFLKGAARILPHNPDALPDFLNVATIWIGEVADAAGKVKTSWLGIPSADPKLSREALRELRVRYHF